MDRASQGGLRSETTTIKLKTKRNQWSELLSLLWATTTSTRATSRTLSQVQWARCPQSHFWHWSGTSKRSARMGTTRTMKRTCCEPTLSRAPHHLTMLYYTLTSLHYWFHLINNAIVSGYNNFYRYFNKCVYFIFFNKLYWWSVYDMWISPLKRLLVHFTSHTMTEYYFV